MSKKRKRDQPEPDAVPAQDDITQSPPPEATESARKKSKGQAKQEKSERRAKKKKESKSATDRPTVDDADASKAEKKSKKSKKSSKDAEDVVNDKTATADDNAVSAKKRKSSGDDAADKPCKKKSKKKHSKEETETNGTSNTQESQSEKTAARFICFVGNLPFEATAKQVEEHFIKLAPTSVRLSTDKATGRGKGFAFVEFDGYDKMKTCLSLYHHSIFNPDSKGDKENKAGSKTFENGDTTSKKAAGRRINVELTAGGGGKKSKGRKDRIESKNKKLDEERERRRIKELAEKNEESQKRRNAPQTGANTAAPNQGDIHPSRLAQMRY